MSSSRSIWKFQPIDTAENVPRRSAIQIRPARIIYNGQMNKRKEEWERVALETSMDPGFEAVESRARHSAPINHGLPHCRPVNHPGPGADGGPAWNETHSSLSGWASLVLSLSPFQAFLYSSFLFAPGSFAGSPFVRHGHAADEP